MGSAMVTDMVSRVAPLAVYGAARRDRPAGLVTHFFGDRRTRRGDASAGRGAAARQQWCQTKAARHELLAGVDAKVKEATTIGLTRP